MWLVYFVAAILFVGGVIAWLCGARTRDIVFACIYIALGCFVLFLLGCVHLVGLLFSPFWGIAAPALAVVFLALILLRIFKG